MEHFKRKDIELSAAEIKKRMEEFGLDTSDDRRFTIGDIMSIAELVFLHYDEFMRMREL